ncbi:sensor histidine kinase [Paenibacillus sp.]|uniref:sensor histidine kinase n=1 Tax=Paenibacillus sp. TaxID=58172 RepID=UPI0028118BB9|nr:sensor histidine kinase [Paenibacillus sp.]
MARFTWPTFFRSIAGQLFLLISIGMIVPVAIGGYLSYHQSSNLVKDQVGNVASLTITQVSNKLNLMLKDLEDTSLFVLGNPVIQKAMTIDPGSAPPYDYMQVNSDAIDLLYLIHMNSTEIMDIFILDHQRKNNILGSSVVLNGLWDTPWYDRIVEADGLPVWFGIQRESFLRRADIGIPVFGMGRAIKSQATGDVIGVLFIEVRATHLTQQLNNVTFGETGYTFIVDQQNRYVYEPRGAYGQPSAFSLSSNDYYIQHNGQETLLLPERLMNGWYVTGVVPIEELNEGSNQIRGLTLMILVCSALFALSMGALVTFRVGRPLIQLSRLMQRGASGDLRVRSGFTSRDEIGKLGRSFDRMLEQIALLMKEMKTEQAEKKKAEIRAMRYQINPHFLYNTLNTVRHLARFNRMEDVNRSIANLIPLLEASIERNGTFVPLGEELDLLEKYMVIQQYRYFDRRLELRIRCPAHLQSMMIPRMLLQPIVENAVFHGIAPKDGPGAIELDVAEDGAYVVIRIADDGVGIEPERLGGLLLEQSTSAKGMTKIGLFHAHQAIRLFYGSDCGLDIRSVPGEGATVTIRLHKSVPKEERYVV